jgi:hypothetical protein
MWEETTRLRRILIGFCIQSGVKGCWLKMFREIQMALYFSWSGDAVALQLEGC